ncbi:MAG: transposase [Moorea sp. SIO2B7]|nr:transposase [Moorena sp. SIO2B7]
MLLNVFSHKQLQFGTVLMDSWYATKKLMLLIEELGKYYYCPLKKNPLVDDSSGVDKYIVFSDET